LSAPLLLPGLQLIDQSGRTSTGNYSSVTIPDHSLLQLFFQGFDGMPTAGSHWFGSVSYQWTADYIGVIALVLGVVAIGVRWKRPEVRGLTIMVAVMATLGLVPAVASAINGLPVVGNVILSRALAPLAFGLSVLAGVGMDALIREYHRPRVRRVAGGGFVASGVLLAAVWLFGRGRLPADEARIREASFLWLVIGTLVGLVVVGGLTWAVRHGNATGRIRAGHLAGGILLACETAFLVASGAPTFSSAPNMLEPTPAVASLQQAVGPSLVGLGTSSCIASTYLGGDELGILPEANILYQVRQFAIYDPLAPTSYFSTWQRLTGTQGGSAYLYQFCPAITSVTLARRFGVGYVLESRGTKGPPGSIFVRAVDDEALYRIPGVAQATVVPAPSDAPLPSDDAVGTPVTINHSDPATISVVTHAVRPQVLRLRITDVPGWRATIDGRPLTLLPYSGVMLQARVPAGHHLIVIRYWPTAFTVGLILAIVSALSLITAGLVAWRRDRRPEAPSAMDPHPPL
jgi:hypothetical protein